jgi:murein DD-endopeptidase MepM/ murein hydrolase activator NlpD
VPSTTLLLGAAALAAALSLPSTGADPSSPDPATSAGAPVPGTYAWPVTGPVIATFEPPGSPYGAGHRGIDIRAPSGTPVRAAQRGVVSFAGSVAGSLYVSVDHPDGVRTTYSWLSATAVARGDRVERGQVVASSGLGHPGGADPPHLHLGARLAGQYIDPLLLLESRSVVGLIRLAPVERLDRPPEEAAPGL